jgi:hypothetical protein
MTASQSNHWCWVRVLFCIVFGNIAASAFAAQVTLSWNPNSESDLAGYKIHYGTASGLYTFHLDVHNVTTYTLTGLTAGQRYYFAATAYNASGSESGYSNQVSFSPPADGDAVESASLAVFRAGSGEWLLDLNGNYLWEGKNVDGRYQFGQDGDLPVAGDWNNDGVTDIGVFRPSTREWLLDLNGNHLWDGEGVDARHVFGAKSDLPVTGDWNNDGVTDIGVFRPSTREWLLDLNSNHLWDGKKVDGRYTFGAKSDLPVTGDWNNDGVTDIGVFRPSTGEWLLDLNGNHLWDKKNIDGRYQFGQDGDLPATGDWNNDGVAEIGVFRPSTGQWLLDLNANDKWDGSQLDGLYRFGTSGDRPIAGNWR